MTVAAGLALLRRFWPAIPIVVLAAALMLTRATLADRTRTLANERTAWSAEIDRAARAKAEAEARWSAQSASAALAFADRFAEREPIIVKSTETVRTYAQTPAGRAVCLSADRLRGIDALDAALFVDNPASAGGSSKAVPTDADPPTAGRVGQ